MSLTPKEGGKGKHSGLPCGQGRWGRPGWGVLETKLDPTFKGHSCVSSRTSYKNKPAWLLCQCSSGRSQFGFRLTLSLAEASVAGWSQEKESNEFHSPAARALVSLPQLKVFKTHAHGYHSLHPIIGQICFPAC